MGVSQGSITTGPAGLKLKASGLIRGDATLLNGFNVATSVRKAATSGAYVITFSVPMAAADYLVRTVTNTTATSTAPYQYISAKTANGFTIECLQYSGQTDPINLHFEVYEP